MIAREGFDLKECNLNAPNFLLEFLNHACKLVSIRARFSALIKIIAVTNTVNLFGRAVAVLGERELLVQSVEAFF